VERWKPKEVLRVSLGVVHVYVWAGYGLLCRLPADLCKSDEKQWGDGAWEADDMCWLCGKWRPVS
jgi:hypothetical protein